MAVRRLNAFVVAFFLAFGLVVQGALPAQGCSCMAPDPYGGLAEADGAFVGTLVEVDRGLEPITNTGQLVDLHFDVEASLKGEIGDAVVVKSASDGAACGIELPVGERAGFLLTQENDEWQGNLCWTMDADALLDAVDGPPEPVQGSPPHLIVMMQLGEAGLAAVDRQGQIVGYGEGPQPWNATACPDDETFIGAGNDAIVRAWSFASLSLLGEYEVGAGSSWIRSLVCTGAGDSFLAVVEHTDTSTSLVRFADGQPEVLAEGVEQLIQAAVGPVAIGGDGIIHKVDPDTGDLTELVGGSVGELAGRLSALVPSPDGSHLAISSVDWNQSPQEAKVIMVDLVERTAVEMTVGCDVDPVWFDDERVSIWDTCASEVGAIYNTELELIGEGSPPPEASAYGWSVTDETGAVFYPGEFGITVIEPGADLAAELVRLPTYPSGVLLVPEQARASWTGSDFVPPPPAEATVTTFVEPLPPGVGSPPWLMVVGVVMVGGVLWLLLRKPPRNGSGVVAAPSSVIGFHRSVYGPWATQEAGVFRVG